MAALFFAHKKALASEGNGVRRIGRRYFFRESAMMQHPAVAVTRVISSATALSELLFVDFGGGVEAAFVAHFDHAVSGCALGIGFFRQCLANI